MCQCKYTTGKGAGVMVNGEGLPEILAFAELASGRKTLH
jgi:hypothetical protein